MVLPLTQTCRDCGITHNFGETCDQARARRAAEFGGDSPCALYQVEIDQLRADNAKLRRENEWLHNHLDKMNAGAQQHLADFCEGLAKLTEDEVTQ